tara:strand:+ start:209 stop:799 length:591 start_codon:yes stop_codon:yes gene_type:complete
VAWVESAGVWGPVVFVVAYATATVAFIPGSLLTLAAGAIFGLGNGTVLVLVGATIGSAGAFLFSRHVARAAIERRLARNPRFAEFDSIVGDEGFKIVLLLRLSLIFPFNLLNYALGLTRVRFRDYVLASVGMLPGSLLYTYYGKLAGDVAMLTGDGPVEGETSYYLVLVLGLTAIIFLTSLITRIASRALHRGTGK